MARGQASIAQELAAMPARLAALRARRDTTRGDSARALLTRQIGEVEVTMEEYRSLTVVLPTMTVDSSLVLFRANGQEIRVFYLGRGHTSGDVVVQLPREGLLIAGDLITNTASPPNLMDSYPGEWGATLRRLAQLDFTTTVPGHGAIFDGKQRYAATADFMDEVWRQVRAAQAAGTTREAVAGAVDVSRHVATFPALRNGLNAVAAQRAWDVAAGRTN
jgi:glyoxylase-like metal-dependent hydrolase (beta-lactamase superfamily II)